MNRYLNEKQEDYLKEIINISFGLSASIIGDMLDSKAVLHLPKIDVLELTELNSFITNKVGENEEDFFITKQLFQKLFHGEANFLLDSPSAENITKLILKRDVNKKEVESVVLELTNIITSACIGQIAEFLGTKVTFMPPDVRSIQDFSTLTYQQSEEYSKVFILETVLDLVDENIKGYMFILMSEEVFQLILEKFPK